MHYLCTEESREGIKIGRSRKAVYLYRLHAKIMKCIQLMREPFSRTDRLIDYSDRGNMDSLILSAILEVHMGGDREQGFLSTFHLFRFVHLHQSKQGE